MMKYNGNNSSIYHQRTSNHVLIIMVISLVACILFLFQEWRLAGVAGVPLDDSWIHFHFARNVAGGNGFTYNPGELTSGSTGPLWVYILAGGYHLTHEFIFTSRALGLIFLCICGWAVYTLSISLFPSRSQALMSAIFTVLTGRFLWGVLSGMEIALFSALSLWGIVFWINSKINGIGAYLGTILLGLATLARPEGAALFLFVIVVQILQFVDSLIKKRNRINLTNIVRQIIFQVVLYCAIISPAILFCLKTTGRPLPNTFYAKTHGFQFGIQSALYLIKVAYYFFLDHPLLFCLIPVGLWNIGTRALKQFHPHSILLFWLFGLPILNAIINPITWHHGRYVMFLIPIFILLSNHGLHHILRSLNGITNRIIWICLTVAVIMSCGLLYHWSIIYSQNVDNINQMDVKMGKWLDDNLPDDAVVAASDVGAIAYFSGRYIIDTDGLVTADIIPFLKEKGRERGVHQYLKESKPDFVVAFHEEFQFLSENPQLFEPVFSLRVVHNTILGGTRMVVYRTKWL